MKIANILKNSNHKRSQFNEENIQDFVEHIITHELPDKAPYFSIDAVRRRLAEQKLTYKPETVKSYLSRQRKAGKIFGAGRGWYSAISQPYQLDTTPVEKLVSELGKAFPLLDFACWSTEQLNEMLRHQIAKHVQFAYVERDAIDSVAEHLRDQGRQAHANPGKQEIQRSFRVEENTVVILPLTSETPQQNGTASFEKILIDVLADAAKLSLLDEEEFLNGAQEIIAAYRVDMAVLTRYATRRKTDVSKLLKGTVIH